MMNLFLTTKIILLKIIMEDMLLTFARLKVANSSSTVFSGLLFLFSGFLMMLLILPQNMIASTEMTLLIERTMCFANL